MAWIESHQDLARHPKTTRLARLLGISLPQAIGHLHLLWWWALDFAPDGDLSGWDAADIAAAAHYDGDPEAFVDSLLGCGRDGQAGFLERLPDGRLVIHDWYEYAGKYAERRQQDAERKRRSRRRTTDSNPSDVQRTSGGQIPESVRNHNQNLNQYDHHHHAHAREEPADSGQPSQRWTDWYEQRTACSVSRTMYEAITEIQHRGGITDDLVIAALEQAIADRARDPLTYAKRILGNCVLYGLRTREEWEAWEQERAAAEEERKLAVVQHRIRAPTVREVHPINEFDFSDFDDAG